MTALAVAVIGLAAAQIGNRDFNQLKYESQFYQDLHKKYYVLVG